MKFIKFFLIILLCGLCSCRASRPVMTETAATEHIARLETAKDSIGSNQEIKTSSSGYLDISDLQIIFFPPVPDIPDVSPTVIPIDSMPDISSRPVSRPHPAIINIGHIAAGSASDTTVTQSKDSVGSKSADLKHDVSVANSEKRIRDPTSTRWPVILILGAALVMIVFPVYRLYHASDS